jgi:hypothetical protein
MKQGTFEGDTFANIIGPVIRSLRHTPERQRRFGLQVGARLKNINLTLWLALTPFLSLSELDIWPMLQHVMRNQ